jgi:hypothetical protein
VLLPPLVPTTVTRADTQSHTLRRLLGSCRRALLQRDQSVDLVDQAVDLDPVVAPAVVVVPRMLHVQRGGYEHGVGGGELVQMFGLDGQTIANVSSLSPSTAGSAPTKDRGMYPS